MRHPLEIGKGSWPTFAAWDTAHRLVPASEHSVSNADSYEKCLSMRNGKTVENNSRTEAR